MKLSRLAPNFTSTCFSPLRSQDGRPVPPGPDPAPLNRLRAGVTPGASLADSVQNDDSLDSVTEWAKIGYILLYFLSPQSRASHVCCQSTLLHSCHDHGSTLCAIISSSLGVDASQRLPSQRDTSEASRWIHLSRQQTRLNTVLTWVSPHVVWDKSL